MLTPHTSDKEKKRTLWEESGMSKEKKIKAMGSKNFCG